MIIDLVLYFGATDSPEAKDSVFGFRKTAGLVRPCAGDCACEDFRVNGPGDGRGIGLVVGEVLTGARAAAEFGRAKPLWLDFGVSKGFA